jgi:prevent-host-death family protein
MRVEPTDGTALAVVLTGDGLCPRPHSLDLVRSLVQFSTAAEGAAHVRAVNIHEARTKLSALIQAVERGEEVVITSRNRPVARLVPATPRREEPVFGSAKAAFERSGLTREDIARALAPMSDEELAERGID